MCLTLKPISKKKILGYFSLLASRLRTYQGDIPTYQHFFPQKKKVGTRMQKYIKGIQYECVLNTGTSAKVENSCFLKIKLAVTAKEKKERMTLTSWIIHGKFTFRSKPEGLILLCHC